MYPYIVKRFHSSKKKGTQFLSDDRDEGFRAALWAVFEPMGYLAKWDETGIHIKPGSMVPAERDITVASDQWFVWCEAHSFGDDAQSVASNHKWIDFVDELLQASGAFVRVPDDEEDEMAKTS